MFNHVSYVGQSELKKALQKNFQQEKINTLCQTASSDGSCNVVCFCAARPIDPFLNDFYAISYKYSSDLFNRFWRDKLAKLTATLTFSDVNAVWDEVIKSCTKLLEELKFRNMTLANVDHYFRGIYLNKLDIMRRDLVNLHHGVSSIKSFHSDSSWIKNIVACIGQYWDLCGYREAAQAFLSIRDTLKLTGDFAIVERVASKVCCYFFPVQCYFMSFYLQVSSFDATLNSIDHSVVDAGRFLQEYTTDPKKKECLEAFTECQKIVKWIKKETKGK